MVERKSMRIAISWSGMPIYAAKLIKEGIANNDNEITLLSTNLQVPIEVTQEITKHKIYVIDSQSDIKWCDLGMEVPEIFFQAGWFVSSFNQLGLQVKSNGGKVVVLSDNCWKNSFRQYLGYLKFNLLYRNRFDASWVPGKSGQRFMKFLGFKNVQIFTGLYGSDPNLFFSDSSILSREKSFVFVGQLIPRKGIKTLLVAFRRFHKDYPDWKLKIFGRGELQSLIHGMGGVEFYDFKSPDEIALSLRSSRFLILPSLEDHWPLVVSEAALSGCGLILSNKIGNSSEFLTSNNGFSFKANSCEQLYRCLCSAAILTEDELLEVQRVSLELGSRFLTKHWKMKFDEIINHFNK
jgi:glycosyltransferase involved in cell wall biosynthesis